MSFEPSSSSKCPFGRSGKRLWFSVTYLSSQVLSCISSYDGVKFVCSRKRKKPLCQNLQCLKSNTRLLGLKTYFCIPLQWGRSALQLLAQSLPSCVNSRSVFFRSPVSGWDVATRCNVVNSNRGFTSGATDSNSCCWYLTPCRGYSNFLTLSSNL